MLDTKNNEIIGFAWGYGGYGGYRFAVFMSWSEEDEGSSTG